MPSTISTVIGISPGAAIAAPTVGLPAPNTPITIAVTGPYRRGVAHLITVAQHASGKELETFFENSRWARSHFSRLSPESPETPTARSARDPENRRLVPV